MWVSIGLNEVIAIEENSLLLMGRNTLIGRYLVILLRNSYGPRLKKWLIVLKGCLMFTNDSRSMNPILKNFQRKEKEIFAS
jgi:hypothetical protein